MFKELYIDFQVFLDAVGLVQGVTLGVLLMFLNRRKHRSSFFLGIFLILFSLELGYWISINTKVAEIKEDWFLLPLNFSWVLFPLFYLYTKEVSVLSKTKTNYWLLIPGIISIVAQIIIFNFQFEVKKIIEVNSWYIFIFWILGNYFSWIVALWNLKLLYKHGIEVKNTYSYIEFKELRWARFFLIYLLANSIFTHINAYVLPDLLTDNTIFSIMDLIAIYWVSYFGLTQGNVRSVLLKDLSYYNSHKKTEEEESKNPTEIAPEKLEKVMSKIEEYMMLSESFINPEFTIMELADAIKTHPRLVSMAINTINQQNFNSYINLLRINKAKILLTTNEKPNLSIEGIGKEVGFNSKSAFYTAFKKYTGNTPTNYKVKPSI